METVQETGKHSNHHSSNTAVKPVDAMLLLVTTFQQMKHKTFHRTVNSTV